MAHKRFMHSNITSSYAYGIIKKNGFLTGEHRAGNLTVLVLILVLCLNRKTEKKNQNTKKQKKKNAMLSLL